MSCVDYQQLLQPSEYQVLKSKRSTYRPKSSYSNGPRNNTITKINKLDLSTADERTPEKVSRKLVYKHFGGTSQERIRHRRANSQFGGTYTGFYPHQNIAAQPTSDQYNNQLYKQLKFQEIYSTETAKQQNLITEKIAFNQY